MTVSTERPLRRDAERNRQRILAAARRVFAARGLGVSMDEIAREAGVGVGTVYRRFRDKDQLIEALFHERVDEIAAIAEDGLRADDPWAGFVSFFERAIELQSADRGLKELMISSGHGQDHVARGRERIAPLVEELVARAQATGDLRPDAAASDFALAQMAIGAVIDFTVDVDPEMWRRCLALFLDGMRTRRDGPSDLPVEPLTVAQVERAMRDWRPCWR